MVLTIAGHVPFDFAGALKIDPETDEVILEPHDRSEEQLARACAALGYSSPRGARGIAG